MIVHNTGEGLFVSEEVSFSKDTDVRFYFCKAFDSIESTGLEGLVEFFKAIDISRKIFVEKFETDDNFKLQPIRRKHAIVMAIHEAAMKARENEKLFFSNGFSVFILWLLAIIFEKYDDVEYIEQRLSDARRKYKL